MLLLIRNNRGCSFILHTAMHLSIELTSLLALSSLFPCCLLKYVNIKSFKSNIAALMFVSFLPILPTWHRMISYLSFFSYTKPQNFCHRIEYENIKSFTVLVDPFCTIKILSSLSVGRWLLDLLTVKSSYTFLMSCCS